jgi:hypothetical protein
MSIWDDHDLTTKVIEILGAVHLNNDVHHFGPPYVSSHQIAIELQSLPADRCCHWQARRRCRGRSAQ